ncbi:MAG: hypothetical protein AB2A00_21520 [Myxococcota bacterium]
MTDPISIELLRAIHTSIEKMATTLRSELNELGTGLRAEIRETNRRLDDVNHRLDSTNERLERLEERTTEGFLQTNTKLAELTLQVDRLGDRVDNILTGQLGQDVRELKGRMERLASKVFGVSEPSEPYNPHAKR